MSPNSQAYRDAHSRIRDAIEKVLMAGTDPELGGPDRAASKCKAFKKLDYLLDDLACEAAYAAFGIEAESN